MMKSTSLALAKMRQVLLHLLFAFHHIGKLLLLGIGVNQSGLESISTDQKYFLGSGLGFRVSHICPLILKH